MSIEQTIGQISENACKEKRQRYIPPRVRAPMSHQQNCHDNQGYDRNHNEESVVALKRSKRGAGIGDVNKMKKVRHHNASIVRTNGSQYQLLRQLVQSIQRERKKENKSHRLRRVEPQKG